MTSLGKRLMKPRFLPVYPLTLWLLLVAHTTERQLHLGIVLAVLGLALRLWANGYIGDMKVNSTRLARSATKIGRMVTAGPYAFIRHPLYLGSVLIGSGVAVIAGSLWVSLALIAFFLLVYRAKMAQEEGLLREEIGTQYVIYHAAVPRWLPAWRRYPNRQGSWRWEGIVKSKEWKTCIWVAALLIALYFREEFYQEHTLLRGGWEWKHSVLLGLAAVAVVFDGLFELKKRSVIRLSRSSSGQPASA